MTEYPILVERLDAGKALRIVCESCGAEADVAPDDIRNEENYDCPRGCGGWALFKYVEADRCRNCGKLGFWSDVLDKCCSRACQLQAEYAAELKAKARTR